MSWECGVGSGTMATRLEMTELCACCSTVLWSISVRCVVAVTFLAISAAAFRDFPAVILFGDSTLDSGTNNYLTTLVKSNFMPYGRDLDGQYPAGSGRFSNGLMVPDYISKALGLPSPLPYLHPNATGDTLLTGINFASAGSGWIDSTNTLFSVRGIRQQKEDFKEYVGKLTNLIGPAKAQDILSNALYIVSSGTNDFVNNYFLLPEQQKSFTVADWQNQILSTASDLLQEIYSFGGRKFLVATVPAFGCLPAAITLHGGGSNQCVGFINDAAAGTNVAMRQMLQDFEDGRGQLPGAQFLTLETYAGLLDAFKDPASWGFEEVSIACCGTGTIEVAILCNSDTPGTCKDASKYLFFDSFHPTQTFYSGISQAILEAIEARF